MTTATTTLTDFLLARIAEDEAAAKAAAHGRSGRWASWNRSWDTERNRDLVDEGVGERMACLPMDLDEHIARHDPARVLAECEAKRRIVEQCRWIDQHPDWYSDPDLSGEFTTCEVVLSALALPYSDHPDYPDP